MDRRNLGEIRINWQLGVFIVALAALPISLAPFYAAPEGARPPERWVLTTSVAVAAACVLAMAVAITSRVHQAAGQWRPDGQPLSAWIVRQVVIGLLLIMFGIVIAAGLIGLGLSGKTPFTAGLVGLFPGVLLIGRALAPPTY